MKRNRWDAFIGWTCVGMLVLAVVVLVVSLVGLAGCAVAYGPQSRAEVTTIREPVLEVTLPPGAGASAAPRR